MGRSLEVRVPLLDTPLVEFVSALPAEARRKSGVQKALLVEALGNLLPAEITSQKKRTFTLPWQHWLCGPLKSRVEDSLSSAPASLARLVKPTGCPLVCNTFLTCNQPWPPPQPLSF